MCFIKNNYTDADLNDLFYLDDFYEFNYLKNLLILSFIYQFVYLTGPIQIYK